MQSFLTSPADLNRYGSSSSSSSGSGASKKRSSGNGILKSIFFAILLGLAITAFVLSIINAVNNANSTPNLPQVPVTGTWVPPGPGSTAPPDSYGEIGQFYIDSDTQEVWYKVPPGFVQFETSASDQTNTASPPPPSPQATTRTGPAPAAPKNPDRKKKPGVGGSNPLLEDILDEMTAQEITKEYGQHAKRGVNDRSKKLSSSGNWIKITDGHILGGDLGGVISNGIVSRVGGLSASYIAEGAILAHMVNGTGNFTLPSDLALNSLSFPGDGTLPTIRVRYVSPQQIEIDDGANGPVTVNVVGNLNVNGARVGDVYAPAGSVTPGSVAFFNTSNQLNAADFVFIDPLSSSLTINGAVVTQDLFVYNTQLSVYVDDRINSAIGNLTLNTTIIQQFISDALANTTFPDTTNETTVARIVADALLNFTAPDTTNYTLIYQFFLEAFANSTFPDTTNTTTVNRLIADALLNFTVPNTVNYTLVYQFVVETLANTTFPDNTNYTLVYQFLLQTLSNYSFPDTTNQTTVNRLITEALATFNQTGNVNYTLLYQFIQSAIDNVTFPDTTNQTTVNILIANALLNYTAPGSVNYTLVYQFVVNLLANTTFPDTTNQTTVTRLIAEALANLTLPDTTNYTRVYQFIFESLGNYTFPDTTNETTVVRLITQALANLTYPDTANYTFVQQLIFQTLANYSFPVVTNETRVREIVLQVLSNTTTSPNVTQVQQIVYQILANFTNAPNATHLNELILQALSTINVTVPEANRTLIREIVFEVLLQMNLTQYVGTNVTLVGELIQIALGGYNVTVQQIVNQILANYTFSTPLNETRVTEIVLALLGNYSFTYPPLNETRVNQLIGLFLANNYTVPPLNETRVLELIYGVLSTYNFTATGTNETAVTAIVYSILSNYTANINVTLIQQLINAAINNITYPGLNETRVQEIVAAAIANITFPALNTTRVNELIALYLANNYTLPSRLVYGPVLPPVVSGSISYFSDTTGRNIEATSGLYNNLTNAFTLDKIFTTSLVYRNVELMDLFNATTNMTFTFGDVYGPVPPVVDGRVALFNGTSGRYIMQSVVGMAPDGNVTGVKNLFINQGTIFINGQPLNLTIQQLIAGATTGFGNVFGSGPTRSAGNLMISADGSPTSIQTSNVTLNANNNSLTGLSSITSNQYIVGNQSLTTFTQTIVNASLASRPYVIYNGLNTGNGFATYLANAVTREIGISNIIMDTNSITNLRSLLFDESIGTRMSLAQEVVYGSLLSSPSKISLGGHVGDGSDLKTNLKYTTFNDGTDASGIGYSEITGQRFHYLYSSKATDQHRFYVANNLISTFSNTSIALNRQVTMPAQGGLRVQIGTRTTQTAATLPDKISLGGALGLEATLAADLKMETWSDGTDVAGSGYSVFAGPTRYLYNYVPTGAGHRFYVGTTPVISATSTLFAVGSTSATLPSTAVTGSFSATTTGSIGTTFSAGTSVSTPLIISPSGNITINPAGTGTGFSNKDLYNVGPISSSISGSAHHTFTTTGNWNHFRITSGTLGNIRLQAAGGGNAGFGYFAWNGGNTDAGELRDNTAKNRYRFYFDQRSTTDVAVIDMLGASGNAEYIRMGPLSTSPVIMNTGVSSTGAINGNTLTAATTISASGTIFTSGTFTTSKTTGAALLLTFPATNTNTGPYIDLGAHFTNTAGDLAGSKIKLGGNAFSIGLGGASMYSIVPSTAAHRFFVTDSSGSSPIASIDITGLTVTGNVLASNMHFPSCTTAPFSPGGSWSGSLVIEFKKAGKLVHAGVYAQSGTFRCINPIGCGGFTISTDASSSCPAFLPNLSFATFLYTTAAFDPSPVNRMVITNTGVFQMFCVAGACGTPYGWGSNQLAVDTAQGLGAYFSP